jgi:hypothetical protein
MVIREQTTRLGPGFYEPSVHPLNCAVKNPTKKSMAFLKTGRRAGPLEWTLNYVPKKDPLVEVKKNPYAMPGACLQCRASCVCYVNRARARACIVPRGCCTLPARCCVL